MKSKNLIQVIDLRHQVDLLIYIKKVNSLKNIKTTLPMLESSLH